MTRWTRIHLLEATGQEARGQRAGGRAGVNGPRARRLRERARASAEAPVSVLTAGPDDREAFETACRELAEEAAEAVLVVPAPLLRVAVATALGAPVARIGPEPGGRAALDWPRSKGARVKLAGLDLDWCPPRPGGRRDDFPGGPGRGEA